MKLSTPLVLSALSLLPSASAWTFTWVDEDGNKSIESGKGPHSCTKIHHAEGEEFAWNNQGNDNIGIYLYASSDCSGTLAGWSSVVWEKEASKDLLGFKVMNEGATTTASATGTSSHTGSSDASATATASTSGGASNSTTSATSSRAGSKTKTKTETSATASSSAESSNTTSGSGAEKTGSKTTPAESSGSTTPSSTASATDGASTDESAASSPSKSNVVRIVSGLALGMAVVECLV